MQKPVESVEIVSDGILVRFSDGLLTYFPQDFLRSHIGIGSNQVFVERVPAASARLHVASPSSLH